MSRVPTSSGGLSPRAASGRTVARWVMAVLYFAAGVFHVATPEPFLMITPDWVPFPQAVIFGTGLCELCGSVALLLPRWRRLAGWAFALYAVCVFPANIKHAFEGVPAGQIQLGWWYHAPRLALQPVLVWWALFCGEIVTWPFSQAKDE